jgi:hypothetical protein
MHATMLCDLQIFRKFVLMHPTDCFGAAMGLLSQQPHLIQGLARIGWFHIRNETKTNSNETKINSNAHLAKQN